MRGFLRIRAGDNPLDQTACTETYPVVERMLAQVAKTDRRGDGRSDVIPSLKPEAFADDKFGAITVRDILAELEKPGAIAPRDFKVGALQRRRRGHQDLKPGMTLEGTVSNVAQFGAFVDLGVHQDGLVHMSQLSNKFVNDARGGQDRRHRQGQGCWRSMARKRISLTMKLDAKPLSRASAATTATNRRGAASGRQRGGATQPQGSRRWRRRSPESGQGRG